MAERMRELKRMKDWELRIAYNVLMFWIAFVTGIALIQHAVFFYTWPPDFSRWLGVPLPAYLLLGGLLFISFKLLHWVEVKAAIMLKYCDGH